MGWSGSWGRRSRAGERAVDHSCRLNDGDNRGSGVSARGVGLNDRDTDDGFLHDHGGDGSNGVSTSRGADIGGGRHNATGGIGADDGGGCLHDGRDTTKGVGAGWNTGRGSTADVLGLSQNDGRGWQGVSAGGGACLGDDGRGSRWRRGCQWYHRGRSCGGHNRGGVGIDAADAGRRSRRRGPETRGTSNGGINGRATRGADCRVFLLTLNKS